MEDVKFYSLLKKLCYSHLIIEKAEESRWVVSMRSEKGDNIVRDGSNLKQVLKKISQNN